MNAALSLAATAKSCYLVFKCNLYDVGKYPDWASVLLSDVSRSIQQLHFIFNTQDQSKHKDINCK